LLWSHDNKPAYIASVLFNLERAKEEKAVRMNIQLGRAKVNESSERSSCDKGKLVGSVTQDWKKRFSK